MRAWRIAKARYALDRSGAGGLAEGGRWHARGTPVIYAGLSVEICAMEKLVHTGVILPADLQLVSLTLPDEAALYESLTPANCPAGRRHRPTGFPANSVRTSCGPVVRSG